MTQDTLPKKTAEIVSVLEAEKSAHKVQRHSKKRLLLFTQLKENLQSYRVLFFWKQNILFPSLK